ncbi:MAG: TlyA family rRNA (cytidine-2'-O)-methyltransferase, partial [Chloroflexi bacterium]|nr:TlyA family rRNA (cytidine-2'-O)-methyltransferase [Chloroflexota bacterium]
VEALYPELPDARASIEEGKIAIDGRIVRNPASMVGAGSCVTVVAAVRLRGEAKLQAALDRFDVPVAGRIALDAGAAAGGFTRVLLDRGAVRVYAVDAGHGQLAGFLRQHPRVVNLERTNLAVLGPGIVPDRIDLITLDLSYLSLTDAVPQLDRLSIGPHADLVALVKPMFELHLSQPPPAAERAALERALATAVEGIGRAGWQVVASMESPVLGSRGAFEFLVHAHRSQASGAGGPE